jgi:hypothetical protein
MKAQTTQLGAFASGIAFLERLTKHSDREGSGAVLVGARSFRQSRIQIIATKAESDEKSVA